MRARGKALDHALGALGAHGRGHALWRGHHARAASHHALRAAHLLGLAIHLGPNQEQNAVSIVAAPWHVQAKGGRFHSYPAVTVLICVQLHTG